MTRIIHYNRSTPNLNNLVKNETLNTNDSNLLEEIYDYLEENYYKCYICDIYFEDHEYVDENANRQECYNCFTEFDNY
ncbi:hypothetical protein LCGC14_1632480 [marine sediment metagenome]|uniref:Uncharacterized protein n=1 Tax=marine sediment metagenome TaxID=412755 RepID=A0A0F9IPG3_9ZZZZ